MGSRTLVDRDTPLEFFRDEVQKAIEHQHLETSGFAAHYLVDLLTRSIRADALPPAEPGFDDVPLALLYLRALRAASHERARRLRETGDTALFVSGFFADSLLEKVADLRYYQALGGSAYARLGRERTWLGSDVFSELAARFQAFVDVLQEVSEKTHLASAGSVLRLYERWLQTGSRRAARLLEEHGISPVDPGEGQVH
ncbi:MAG TPA: hypothetical protein VMX54_21800 [Vicinamibacteria bacterium]|nr:hypothetical protein [Vicinamibacteria bacterium]